VVQRQVAEPDEPILLRQSALLPKVHLVSTKGRTRLRFQPSGGNVGSNVTFTLCDGRGPAKATAYVIGNNSNLHAAIANSTNVEEACKDL